MTVKKKIIEELHIYFNENEKDKAHNLTKGKGYRLRYSGPTNRKNGRGLWIVYKEIEG